MKRNQTRPTLAARATEPAAPSEGEIQKEAYYLWLENGRPEGRDVEFWHAARELLRHRHGPATHSHPPGFAILHFPPSHEAQRPVGPRPNN
jgi:hypothetical protein